MMRKLQLDYIQRPMQVSAAAWLLALIAVAFAADVMHAYYTLRQKVAQDSATLARVAPQRSGLRPGTTAGGGKNESLEEARDTLLRLTTPWGQLFSALETAQSDRVALLAVEPDVKAGSVVLAAEARDYLAALAYVATLAEQRRLKNVLLIRHEIRGNDANRPVSFQVSATWRDPI